MYRNIHHRQYHVNTAMAISQAGSSGDDPAMVSQPERKAWVRGVVARQCGGNAAAFGRAIGKDSSYVSRMLAMETRQQRGISDAVIARILEAFPNEPAPPGWRQSAASAPGSGAGADLIQLRQMVVAMALALARAAPEVAELFRQTYVKSATVPGHNASAEALFSAWLEHTPDIAGGQAERNGSVHQKARQKRLK